jgi:hypothetical protein
MAGHMAGVTLKFLGPRGDGYSAILASFHNQDTRRAFTVAQLLYLGADQQVEKVHLRRRWRSSGRRWRSRTSSG